MGSYDVGKDIVCSWIRDRFPTNSKILDVGACDGKWKRLLPEYSMDAIEIFKPYADKLTGYDHVINKDISGFEYIWYDLIIFGDVIEHMDVTKAKRVLEYASVRCHDMIVAVPFEYKQDEVDGNKWQKHIQDDLTPLIFMERYPGFEIIFYDKDHEYCYYHKLNIMYK